MEQQILLNFEHLNGYVTKYQCSLCLGFLTNLPSCDFPVESWCCCQVTSLLWNCLNEVRTGEERWQQAANTHFHLSKKYCKFVKEKLWIFHRYIFKFHRNYFHIPKKLFSCFTEIWLGGWKSIQTLKIRFPTICGSASNKCILHNIENLWILLRKLRYWENDKIQVGRFSSNILLISSASKRVNPGQDLIKPCKKITNWEYNLMSPFACINFNPRGDFLNNFVQELQEWSR